MSITRTTDKAERQRRQIWLIKALSWYFSNREYRTSVVIKNGRKEQQRGAPLLLGQDLQFDNNINENANGRMRLSRLNPFTSERPRTKAKKMKYAAFIDHEQRPEDLNLHYSHNTFDITSKIGTTMAKDTSRSSKTPGSGQKSATTFPTLSRHTQGEASPQPRSGSAYTDSGAPKIPNHLPDEEQAVYWKLLTLARSREFENEKPPEIIVITDIGKDYDDLAAMVLLKELHRIGVVKLLGFVANLHPAKERARFARGALDYLGLEDIPVCWGESAVANPGQMKPPGSWEFPYDDPQYAHFKEFPAKHVSFTPYNENKKDPSDHFEIESGINFLERMVSRRIAARENDPTIPKITFLLISGLSDIATLAKRQPEKLALATESVVFQGDYKVEQKPPSYHAVLTPIMLAANNSFDKQATIDFHAYVDNNRIPTRVFTKSAAMGARMSPSFFVDLKNTKHPLGIHLQAIQSVMDINFYETACGPVEKRFKAEFDRAWFLKGKTDFNEKAKEFARANPGTTLPFPVGKEVIPYALLLLYDIMSALGAAGDDVLSVLELLDPPNLFALQDPHIHKVVGHLEEVGTSLPPPDKPKTIEIPDINVTNFQIAIRALMRGSLLAVGERLPSTHTTQEMWEQGHH